MSSPDLGRVMAEAATIAKVPGSQEAPELKKPQGSEGPGANGALSLKEGELKSPLGDEKVAGKLQTLIRREKIALEKEKAAKTLEEKIEAREKVLEAREAKLKEFETLKETAPLKALELLGLSYEELTQIALSDGNIPGEITAEKRLSKLEEKIEADKKAREEREKADAERVKTEALREEKERLDEFQKEIDLFLEQNPKDYELIAFHGMSQKVFETIDEHYNRTIDPKTGIGKIMSMKEAADKVEEALEKKYEKAPQKLVSRFSSRPSFLPKPRPNPVKPTTLTNNLSATPSQPRKGILTDAERIQKAIAYAKGLRP